MYRAVGESEEACCVAAIVTRLFEEYPDAARRSGRHELDGRLPDPRVRPAGELRLLATEASRLLTALPDEADPELRADLDAAARIASGEIFRATELDQPGLTPLEVLGETDLSPYLRPYAPLDQRLAAADAHLALLPSFLADAISALPADLPAGERLLAMEQAHAQAINIGNIVRELSRAEQAYGGAGTERHAVAGQAASAGCARFARAVAATKPSPALLGPARLSEFLRITEGIDDDPNDLLEEASAEIARVLSALNSAARSIGAAGRQEAWGLMADQVTDVPITGHVTSVIERLRDFWERQDVVSVDTVLPLEVHSATGLGTAIAVEFSPSPPLEPVRQPHVLYIPEPPATTGARDRTRRQYLNDPMVEVIAVHEAYAGHYLHAEATAHGPSVVRACFPWLSGYTEGWAHYAEELAIEHGLADGRPLVKIAQLKSALEAAVRLVSYLSVHLRRSTFMEASALAARTCDWSAERAAREVLIVAADPGPAMYTLAKLRIREWRAAAGLTTRPSLKAFHDRLLRCGHAPLATARRYCMDGMPRLT